MSTNRIRMIESDEAPAELLAIYDRADSAMQDGHVPGPTLFGNQIRALAHHPALLQALLGVYEAYADSPSLARKLMELGVLICSRVNACDYCLQHHTPLAHASGLGVEQLRCVQQGTWAEARELWSEQEWAGDSLCRADDARAAQNHRRRCSPSCAGILTIGRSLI